VRAASALALALGLSGCTVLYQEIDRPTGWTADHFEEGKTRYGEILDALGPPAKVSRTANGFAFLYEHLHVRENQLGISYNERTGLGINLRYIELIKFSTGKAWADRESLVLTFDKAGVLQTEKFTAWREDLGTGSSVQFAAEAGSVVDTSSVSEDTSQNRWGMMMLRPLPRTLNESQNIDSGAHGLEQRGVPDNVGQRALEMSRQERQRVGDRLQ
jgi:hypothetical protein